MKSIDRYFGRNTLGVSLVEGLWGLGLPVVIESTFIQLFLRSAGADSFIIGLVPSILAMGLSITPFFSGFLTAGYKRKRGAVVLLHILPALFLVLLGLLLLKNEIPAIPLFLICYTGFSVTLGLTFPVWQNYLVKIFSEKKVVKGLGIMMVVQSVFRIIGSFAILKVVEQYAFNITGAALIFLSAGGVFTLGSFFFLITKEESEDDEKRKDPILRYFKNNFKKILANKNYFLFLFSDLDNIAGFGVIAFYANYAVEHCLVDPAIAAGGFVAAGYMGGIGANILFGWLNRLKIKQKLYLSKFCIFTGIFLLLFVDFAYGFLAASFLIGFSRGIRMIVFTPAIKKFSGEIDSTFYFSMAPLIILPLSMGIPLLNGTILDSFKHLEGNSYKIIFALMLILVLISLFFLKKTDFGQNTGSKKINQNNGL